MFESRYILFPAIREKIAAIRLKVTPNRFHRKITRNAVALGFGAFVLGMSLSGCGSNSQPFSSTGTNADALVVNPTTIDFGDVSWERRYLRQFRSRTKAHLWCRFRN